ncbi:transposase [Hymenobacter saemangeumensis]|uniref:Transposase n=1 Tax=Hymenobacter saemangeumensis TaxID=1084522 RepID=A0ABP8I9I6_9BACT
MLRLYIHKGSFDQMKDGIFADKYRIASARRPGYDYGQAGWYFITICTQGRQPYFGSIQPAGGALADAYLLGTALAVRAIECWQQIPQHFPFVEPDAFVVMPDHVHGILFFHQSVERLNSLAPTFGPQSKNLAAVVRGFKVGVKAWATHSSLDFAWQPRYFDRVIRNEIELQKIRDYIKNNPNRWDADSCHDSGVFV